MCTPSDLIEICSLALASASNCILQQPHMYRFSTTSDVGMIRDDPISILRKKPQRLCGLSPQIGSMYCL